MTDTHLGLPSGGKVGGVPKWKIFSRGQQECPRFEPREAWGSRFRGSACGRKPGPAPCFAFNRFAHGNRRLLCSTHSGVTCHPYSRCRRQRAFDLALGRAPWAGQRPQNPDLGDHHNPHSDCARIATLPHQDRAQIPPRNRSGSRQLNRPGSGRGSDTESGRNRQPGSGQRIADTNSKGRASDRLSPKLHYPLRSGLAAFARCLDS